MSRLRMLTALIPVVMVLAASQWGWADSITLTSSGGGVYDYELTVTSPQIEFAPKATITLSGLSGVTGASVTGSLPGCFTEDSFTPSSAVIAQTINPFGSCGFPGPATYGTLSVNSSVLTLGTINFSIQADDGTITGTTQGPVAATPEPSSLVLLGTAMLGLVGLARRRLFD